MRIARVAAGTCLAPGLLLLASGTAAAAPGTTNGGSANPAGYQVSVTVTYSGDAAPGGGSTSSVSIPAKCWWSQLGDPSSYGGIPSVDGSDPTSVQAWYEAMFAATNGTFAPARGSFPDPATFAAVIAREAAGEDMTWYRAQCRDGVNMVEEGFGAGTNPAPASWGGAVAVTFAAFPAAQGAPQPLVDPEDLAQTARNAMVIEAPTVDRNPKASQLGGSTLVRLPTWFWVTNGEAALGGDGVKQIRADVQGTGVWAEVTARTGGLALRSPAGSTSCGPTLALTPWGPGAGAGCTVSFTRASTAGPYAVQASTQWDATWVGSDGAGGNLAPLARETVVQVPVAESQAIVTRPKP